MAGAHIRVEARTKRDKQVIKQSGDLWLVIGRMENVPCLDGATGLLIQPMQGDINEQVQRRRWIREDDFGPVFKRPGS